MITNRRAMLLLEVVVGVALLAVLAVGLLRVQAAALKQIRQTEEREAVAQSVQQLLWTWSSSQEPVSRPATGLLDPSHRWDRTSRSGELCHGCAGRFVTVLVRRLDAATGDPPLFRVDWFVPQSANDEQKQ